MNVFEIRNRLVDDYAKYIRGFINIQDLRIKDLVERELAEGLLWPAPLLQLNPSFESGGDIETLVEEGVLHPECTKVFRIKPDPKSEGKPLRLHRHQTEAIKASKTGM